MTSPIIQLDHVCAGYGTTEILHDVSFSIQRGEIFVLLGGSGCGKSTLLKHLIGINPILSGSLTVAGLDWTAAHRAKLCRTIGVTFQSGALFGSMSVLENVMLPLEEWTHLSRARREERAHDLLKQVGLDEAANQMPNEISGGMKKRAAIARALALEPEILFLDEPSAGLDPLTSSALDDLILHLHEQKLTTFVIVSHELASIFKIATRCAMFDKARHTLVAFGEPKDLKENSSDAFVRAFFNRGEVQ